MTQLIPYNFQQADVNAIMAAGGTGLVVAEVGAGKTMIAAATVAQMQPKTTLILAPQGTHETVWRKTFTGYRDTDIESPTYGEWIEGVAPDLIVQRINSSAPGKKAMDDLEWDRAGVYLMTPQLFTKWAPLHLRPDQTIVDEFHLFGNSDSKGGVAIRKFAASTGARLPMSGTMVRNKFENMWTAMRFAYPHRSDPGDIADVSKNRWIDDNCATEYDHFAPGNRKVVGELQPGAFVEKIPCYRQHFKRQECCEFHPDGFLSHLPEPVRIEETIELLPEQKAAIMQMERDYLAYLDLATEEWKALPPEERKKRALVTKVPIVRTTRIEQMTLAVPSIIPREWKGKKVREDGVLLRDDAGQYVIDWGVEGEQYQWIEVDGQDFMQALEEKHGTPQWEVVFAPDAKSPKLDKLIEKYREYGEPMVAATSSQKFAELAVNRLNAQGIRAFEWSGVKTQAERDAALAQFERGELDMIVGQTDAVGTGIDGLQLASGILVRLNRSGDVAGETQLEGRLDRRGQKRNTGVISIEILAEDTNDLDRVRAQIDKRMKLNASLRRSVK
jgi:superfamily II DNA or RNA helicase